MSNWVTDMSDLVPPVGPARDVLAPGRRLAAYFGAIVSAASLAPTGEVVPTAPAEIESWCSDCRESRAASRLGGWRRRPRVTKRRQDG